MTSLSYDIKEKIKRLNVFEKIIMVNIVVFFAGWLIQILNKIPRERTLTWLELPKDALDFIVMPWTIITYGFTHYDFVV